MSVPVEHEVNRSQQQLDRVFGQLQKLLGQREGWLAGRKAWTELPPEASPDEHLDRLQALRGERKRQPGMQELADKLSGFGDRLLEQLTPTDDQREMQQRLKSQLREVGRRERFQQQREELMEQTLREVLTEEPQAHPPGLQHRMLQVAGKVHQLSNEMQQPRPVPEPVPVLSAQEATRNQTAQETARIATLRYEQARIEARQDKAAQHEAVTMAKELGYEPSRLANEIQGHSGLGSSVVAAAASLRALGAESRKAVSTAAGPRAFPHQRMQPQCSPSRRTVTAARAEHCLNHCTPSAYRASQISDSDAASHTQRDSRKEGRDMHQLWEVDVPIKNNDQPGLRVHVFVGLADGPVTACTAAHDAYDTALQLYRTGQEIPRSTSWCARGLRPDWELDWAKATAAPWLNPYGLPGTYHLL
ncbi:hypothetical protein ACIBL8_45060 [Streptomyces sp. NPDC050523]|uniref:hypothetical protein n=1 Tax=Streptomyces sp. NPDC050523 TaxID=3365622 RepID=UPI003790D174